MVVQENDLNCANALNEIQQRRLIYFFSCYHLLTMELKMLFNTSIPPGILSYIFSGYKIIRPWLMATRLKGPINDFSVIIKVFQDVLDTGFFVNPPPIEIYSRQLLKFISVLAGNKSSPSSQHSANPPASSSNTPVNTPVPTPTEQLVKPSYSIGVNRPPVYSRNHGSNTGSSKHPPRSSYNTHPSLSKSFPSSSQNQIPNHLAYPANSSASEYRDHRYPVSFSSAPPIANRNIPVPNTKPVASMTNGRFTPSWNNQPNRRMNETVHPSSEYTNVRSNVPLTQVPPPSTLNSKPPSESEQASQIPQDSFDGDTTTPNVVEPSPCHFNFQRIYPNISPYLTPDNIGASILYSTTDFSKSKPHNPRLNLSLELKLRENNLEKGELKQSMKGDLRNLADWDAISLVSSQFPSLPASNFRPDGSFLKHRRFNDEVMENKEILEKAIKQLNLSPLDAERLRERNRVQLLDDKKVCTPSLKDYPSKDNQLLARLDNANNEKLKVSNEVIPKAPATSVEDVSKTKDARNKNLQESEVVEDVPLSILSHKGKGRLPRDQKRRSGTKPVHTLESMRNEESSNEPAFEKVDLSSIRNSEKTSDATIQSTLAKDVDDIHERQIASHVISDSTKSVSEITEIPNDKQKGQGTGDSQRVGIYEKDSTQNSIKELSEREHLTQTKTSAEKVDIHNNQNPNLLPSYTDDELVNPTNSEVGIARKQDVSLTNGEGMELRNPYVSPSSQMADSSDSEEQFRDAVLSDARIERNNNSDGKHSIENVEESSYPTLDHKIHNDKEYLNIKALLNDESTSQSTRSDSFNEEALKSKDASGIYSLEKEPSENLSLVDTSHSVSEEKETLQPVNSISSEIDSSVSETHPIINEPLNKSKDLDDATSDLSKQLNATKIIQDVPSKDMAISEAEIEANKHQVLSTVNSLPQGFAEYKCKWDGCESTLHTLNTLFIHLKKLHFNCEDGGSTLKCCWGQCCLSLGPEQIDAHIYEHLEKIQHICKVPGCKKGFSVYKEFHEHLLFSHLPYKFQPAAFITTRKSRLQEGNRRTRNNQGNKSSSPEFFLNTSTPIIKPAPLNWYPVPPPGFSPSVFARLNQSNQAKEKTISSLAKRNVSLSFSGLHNDDVKTASPEERSSASDAQYARPGRVGRLFTSVSKANYLPAMIIEGTVVQRKNWVVH
ncbi:cryptic loci regulator Clr1 [Schizosaccharomyces cryophilus OY26]|uniref:Cryptic loci regulator Clr1 n=1 Tax=Schizosaccharomyces cryophilus (strain OY26 / ATCC MYA-4695 / CBS 11777 / NBRC 106824 / NRRL Y48691) TaxID=653667 RepID=S9W5W0_SCHCR|nr:cryptic loci regulator Clr1 [Schizosaccharomyces cryophilus OY26]EPY53944.1 cryptic loci regulator Clr1 [Schizosaccharomyces cryophilus OY26]